MPDTIKITGECKFLTEAFGDIPYTGAVILSPGPGIPMGLSAAAACSCCRSDHRAYMLFTDGVLKQTGFIANGKGVPFTNLSLTILKTQDTYYKVGYLPGTQDISGCCKCISQQYELNIPLEETVTTLNWCEAHKRLKQRGTTATVLKTLSEEVARLRQENMRYRKQLGLSTTPNDGVTNPDKTTEALIADVLASYEGCNCG